MIVRVVVGTGWVLYQIRNRSTSLRKEEPVQVGFFQDSPEKLLNLSPPIGEGSSGVGGLGALDPLTPVNSS